MFVLVNESVHGRLGETPDGVRQILEKFMPLIYLVFGAFCGVSVARLLQREHDSEIEKRFEG